MGAMPQLESIEERNGPIMEAVAGGFEGPLVCGERAKHASNAQSSSWVQA